MIDFLEHIDRQILLFINGYHNPFADSLMWFLSGKVILVPIIIITYFFLWKKYNWKGLLLITISIACTIILTDQLSVHLFKEVLIKISHKIRILKTKKVKFTFGCEEKLTILAPVLLYILNFNF